MRDYLRAHTDFKVVRLTSGDLENVTDNWKTFRELILTNEAMYPSIGRWLKDKVVPGLKCSKRLAYVGYLDNRPVVTAVLKLGKRSKICHLRIVDECQDMLLGEVFFSVMALEVRSVAQEIYFTLPEGLWEKEGPFFQSFGFYKARHANRQYRSSECELECSAPFGEVSAAVINKLPKLVANFSFNKYINSSILMSIKPDHIAKILGGSKMVEIRKQFSDKWIGCGAALYASAPVFAITGQATINDVMCDKPSVIWDAYNRQIGCSKQQFDQYVGQSGQVYALVLKDIKQYSDLIYLDVAKKISNKQLTPPQSYLSLDKSEAWGEAMSVATLLKSFT